MDRDRRGYHFPLAALIDARCSAERRLLERHRAELVTLVNEELLLRTMPTPTAEHIELLWEHDHARPANEAL